MLSSSICMIAGAQVIGVLEKATQSRVVYGAGHRVGRRPWKTGSLRPCAATTGVLLV